MSDNFLEKIIAAKQKEVAEAKLRLPQDKILETLQSLSPDGTLKNHSATKRSFAKAISAPGKVSLIAEVKKASPSKGVIREDFDPVKIAREYQSAGASALSVLTDEKFFQGHASFVGKIKDATKLPILRKDFIIDEYQIYHSALIEADCILLIADILTKKQISDFIMAASLVNVEILIEANTEETVDRAIESGAHIIGINNRDLNTFEVDLKTTEKYIKKIPKDKIIVSESGIKSESDIKFLQSLGVNAVLIGEAFMAAPDISARVKEVMGW